MTDRPAPVAPARLVVAYAEDDAPDLLRHEVSRFAGAPEDAVVIGRACPRCGSDQHGRPVVLATARLRTPPHVSLSRAGGLTVVAVTDAGPVGVDVEPAEAARFRGIEDVALHPSERARDVDPTRVWVRKEAVLKACGLGLTVDPRHLALDDDGVTAWDSPYPDPGRVLLRDVAVPGHTAAVAVLVDDDMVVTVQAGGR